MEKTLSKILQEFERLGYSTLTTCEAESFLNFKMNKSLTGVILENKNGKFLIFNTNRENVVDTLLKIYDKLKRHNDNKKIQYIFN